jgi:hypothetical protein
MYQSVLATSKTLQHYLETQIVADPFLGGSGPGAGPFTTRGMKVSLRTPKEMENLEEGVSLWLYRVVVDDQSLNDPPRRISATQVQDRPLPLRLHYLVTPLTSRDNDGDPDTEQYLLGKVLQLFHSKPCFRGADLREQLTGTDARLTVRLETMGLEEITRVWDALEGSYQLSVSYEVSTVQIDSGLQPVSGPRVKVVVPEHGIIVGAEAGSAA